MKIKQKTSSSFSRIFLSLGLGWLRCMGDEWGLKGHVECINRVGGLGKIE
jgi:hypothetical protein